jgi:3-oxoacyl-[acyl-carrier protein] reductase
MNPTQNSAYRPTALITGGVGGIGRAICHTLALNNIQVLFTYRSKADEAHQLEKELAGSGHQSFQLDVSDSYQIDKLALTISEKTRQLDLLVNCAGMTRFVPHQDLESLDDDLIDQIFQVNWRGSFSTIRSFRQLLENSPEALIINISSIAGKTGEGSNVAYCASKAALDSMTRSLARALAPKIRVVSVAPGVVETEFIKRLDPDWREKQLSRTPSGHFAQPEEVAKAILHLFQDLKSLNGCRLDLDGGRPLG